MATQTQTIQRKPVQVRELPIVILGPSPARASIRHVPRDEQSLKPQGLRKRGQNTSSSGSATSAQSELKRESWRAINTRSAASGRSEQSLGILDYYLDPAKQDLEDSVVDPAMKHFDFGLMSKRSAASSPTKSAHESQDELRSLASQRSSRERTRLHRPPPTRKRKAGYLWSSHERRSSSLSICCQGGPKEAYIMPSQEPQIQPAEQKRPFTPSSRSRKDSGASIQDQRSPTDSRFTDSSCSYPSGSWSSDTRSNSWEAADTLRLSAGSSSTQSVKPKRKLSSLFGYSPSHKRQRMAIEAQTSPAAAVDVPISFSNRMRALLLCSSGS